FGVGHALHAMHTGFEFQFGEDAAAMHFGDDFLESAFAAFAPRYYFGLPALLGGVALVHAEQVAGEQRRLVAAGAGANFEDGVMVVHRILRQQREADVVGQLLAARLQRRLLGLREPLHLAVGRRVGDQGVEVGDLAFGGAIGLDRIDHRRELGVFAR